MRTKILCISFAMVLIGTCEALSSLEEGCGYIKEVKGSTIVIEEASFPKDSEFVKKLEEIVELHKSIGDVAELSLEDIANEFNKRTGNILEISIESAYAHDLAKAEYIPIEDLKPGDKVAYTYHGNRALSITKVPIDCIVSDSDVDSGAAGGIGYSNGKVIGYSF